MAEDESRREAGVTPELRPSGLMNILHLESYHMPGLSEAFIPGTHHGLHHYCWGGRADGLFQEGTFIKEEPEVDCN